MTSVFIFPSFVFIADPTNVGRFSAPAAADETPDLPRRVAAVAAAAACRPASERVVDPDRRFCPPRPEVDLGNEATEWPMLVSDRAVGRPARINRQLPEPASREKKTLYDRGPNGVVVRYSLGQTSPLSVQFGLIRLVPCCIVLSRLA